MLIPSVQLRPTVQRMAKALEFDVSLLERLYTKSQGQIERTMLDVSCSYICLPMNVVLISL
jgi:hypothetical protein